MRTWRPILVVGSVLPILLVPIAWSLAAVLASRLFPVFWGTFWLGLGVVVLALAGLVVLYWCVAAWTMRYRFDRNALILSWGGNRQAIPMNRIGEVRRWAAGERVREHGVHWSGLHRGRGSSAELGPCEFCATAGWKHQVVVRTADGSFVLSPRGADEFIQELELRRSLGITRQMAQEKSRWWPLSWSIWGDPTFWLLAGLALLVNLALFALLCYWYPILRVSRPLLPLHYSQVFEEGRVRIVPDIIGPAADLFKLPTFGFLILGGNGVLAALLHRRHRLLVLLLMGVTLVVQVMFALGAIYILYR